MYRTAVFAVILSLGGTSVAWAGETLVGAAARVARQAASPVAQGESNAGSRKPVPKIWTWTLPSLAATMASESSSNALEQEQPAMSTSGMRRRTKLLIFLGAAAAFIGTAYTIDHKVEDNTPSTLGTRED